MQFLKNKHLIIAMIVAPILAILAYVGTDQVVSEKPQSAQEGASYPLAAKSNCRYQSGNCTLHNGDIEIRIEALRNAQDEIEITLSSETQMDKVLIAFSHNMAATTPTELFENPSLPKQWRTRVDVPEPDNTTMRIAVNIAGSTYFIETPAIFLDYETSFSRDNFSS